MADNIKPTNSMAPRKLITAKHSICSLQSSRLIRQSKFHGLSICEPQISGFQKREDIEGNQFNLCSSTKFCGTYVSKNFRMHLNLGNN